MESESESEDHENEKLVQIWKDLSPPNTQSEAVQRWYGAIYVNKGKPALCIGKALKRFLTDENGCVESLQLDCWKPRVGTGCAAGNSESFTERCRHRADSQRDQLPTARDSIKGQSFGCSTEWTNLSRL